MFCWQNCSLLFIVYSIVEPESGVNTLKNIVDKILNNMGSKTFMILWQFLSGNLTHVEIQAGNSWKKFINYTCEKNRTNILLGDVAALNYGGGLTTGLWGGGVGDKNKRHICVFTGGRGGALLTQTNLSLFFLQLAFQIVSRLLKDLTSARKFNLSVNSRGKSLQKGCVIVTPRKPGDRQPPG